MSDVWYDASDDLALLDGEEEKWYDAQEKTDWKAVECPVMSVDEREDDCHEQDNIQAVLTSSSSTEVDESSTTSLETFLERKQRKTMVHPANLISVLAEVHSPPPQGMSQDMACSWKAAGDGHAVASGYKKTSKMYSLHPSMKWSMAVENDSVELLERYYAGSCTIQAERYSRRPTFKQRCRRRIRTFSKRMKNLFCCSDAVSEVD